MIHEQFLRVPSPGLHYSIARHIMIKRFHIRLNIKYGIFSRWILNEKYQPLPMFGDLAVEDKL